VALALLVVDYIGIANELKQALKTYTDSKGKGEPTLNAEEAFSIFIEKIDAIRGMFGKTPTASGLDISGYETQAHKLLVPAANYLLGLEDGKQRFLDLVLAASKAYSLCGTLDETQELKKEIAFYSAIKATIINCEKRFVYRRHLLTQHTFYVSFFVDTFISLS